MVNIARVLVVEDDRSWQQILLEILNDAGYEVDVVDNLISAQRIISRQTHRLAVIDLSLVREDHNNQDGLAVMDYLQQHDPGCVSILLTGFATVEIAVAALSEKGAYTCLRKELFQRSEFINLVRRALSLPPKSSFESFLEDTSVSREKIEKDKTVESNGRVLVVEDDAGWRSIFKELLEDTGYIVDMCASYGEALGYLKRETCDVAIIDLSLEGNSTIPVRYNGEVSSDYEGYRLLSAFQTGKTPIIIVSGEASVNEIDVVFNEKDIFAFIEKQNFDRNSFILTIAKAIRDQSDRTLLEKLTNREREVLELLAHGKTNKEIAEKLVITPNTVKRHLKAIFEKLDIHTRSTAAVMAANWFGPSIEDDSGQ